MIDCTTVFPPLLANPNLPRPSARATGPKKTIQRKGKTLIRQSRPRSGINAEKTAEALKEMEAQVDGALDALREKDSDEKPKPDLNGEPDECAPAVMSDRYHFVLASTLPSWPVFAILALLLAMPCYLSVAGLHWQAGILSWTSLVVVVLACRWLSRLADSREYISWLRPMAYPQTLDDITDLESVCEHVHKNPEFSLNSYFTVSFVWWIQCYAALTSPLNYVISGVSYHLRSYNTPVTKVDPRLPTRPATSLAG
jgi:hypothetical protein